MKKLFLLYSFITALSFTMLISNTFIEYKFSYGILFDILFLVIFIFGSYKLLKFKEIECKTSENGEKK